MAKRISQLTNLTSASLDTTLLGIDRGTSYKIELDVLADAVKDRINTIDSIRLGYLENFTASFTASFASGTISGSSQLTSSFDARYTLSGSVVNVNTSSLVNRLNTIESVSGSWITESETGSFLTSLNGAISSSVQVLGGSGVVSGSYETTGRGIWSGSTQLPSGIISGSSQLNNATITNLTVTNLTTFNQTSSVLYTSGSNQLGDELTDIQTLSGSVRVQGSLTINGTSVSTQSFVDVSALNSATSSYETKGRSIISSSAQITSLGFVSGSYLTSLNGAISSSEQVLGGSGVYSSSAQINGNIYSAGSSVTIQDLLIGAGTTFGKVTTDGSKYISVMPTYNVESTRFWPNGNVTIQTGGDYVDNGFRLEVSGSTKILGSFITTDGITGSTNFDTIVNKPTLISGSSQLTSSFDTRYTLSGSVVSGTTPAGTISGSSQLTSSFDGRYVLETETGSLQTSITSLNTFSASENTKSTTLSTYTSSLNIWTSSVATTGSNSFNGNQTITGSLVVSAVAVVNGGITVPTGSVITLTTGSSISVDSSGAITGSLTGSVFGIGDVVAFSSSVNSRINNITSSTIPTGTISGSSQLTASYDTRYVLSGSITQTTWDNIVSKPSGIISGSSQLPSGIVSGSSQLTASYDTRYILSGSVVSGTTPAGTISGSSQLTSSFDGRYTQTGSFNTLTASFNSFTASAQSVTTGSNSFNGTQIITGSLIITTGSFVASQITTNTASLYLTSGSNLYVQNNGLVEISGSLRVSGSTTFTGSLTISSGSVTMPDRPAFRVIGAGAAISATTTISGSNYTADYSQGSGWNQSTGLFTAPIAGLYQVNIVARANSNSGPTAQVIVYKNSTTQIMVEWAANTTANHMGGSTITKLAVGDVLKAVVTVGTISFDGNDNFSVAYIG